MHKALSQIAVKDTHAACNKHQAQEMASETLFITSDHSSTTKHEWRLDPHPVDAHIDHLVEEVLVDGVANTRRTIGVYVDIIKPQCEFQIQGTDVSHGGSHGVAGHIQRCIRVLLLQGFDCCGDVRR